MLACRAYLRVFCCDREGSFMSIVKALAVLGAGLVFCLSNSASAAVWAGGDDLEIGWTGGTAFGPYVVNGAGTARGVFAVPTSGYSSSFSTAPYASSTNTTTAVSDTNIRITNTAFGGWFPPQWFQYLDYDNTLPDFRNLSFTLDTANTTVAGFDMSTRFQVDENAVAIEFGEIAPGQVISINVAVPEPATAGALSVAGAGLACVRRRRCASR
jgi:hypothetical protein